MADKPRRTKPFAETEATRVLQRAAIAEQVWSEIEVQKVVTAEKTARSKAQPRVLDPETSVDAKSSKSQTTER